MTGAGLRPIASLLVRFALLYGLFLWGAVRLPVFEQVERPLVGVVDAVLDWTEEPGVTRRLALQGGEPGWSYALQVGPEAETRRIERGFHAHAYVLLLLVALILATPGLGWRHRLGSLLIGSGLSFAFAAGLLLSDVQAWEREALGDGAAAGSLLWGVAEAFDAVHRSAAAGFLPVLLWLLYASARGLGAGNAPRPGEAHGDAPSAEGGPASR